MKIQKTIELNELDFLKNIQFYGDTTLDKRTVERIEELKELFSSVLYELYILDKNISDRKEKSADDIRVSLKEMRKTLLSDLAVYENIDVLNSTDPTGLVSQMEMLLTLSLKQSANTQD